MAEMEAVLSIDRRVSLSENFAATPRHGGRGLRVEGLGSRKEKSVAKCTA